MLIAGIILYVVVLAMRLCCSCTSGCYSVNQSFHSSGTGDWVNGCNAEYVNPITSELKVDDSVSQNGSCNSAATHYHVIYSGRRNGSPRNETPKFEYLHLQPILHLYFTNRNAAMYITSRTKCNLVLPLKEKHFFQIFC